MSDPRLYGTISTSVAEYDYQTVYDTEWADTLNTVPPPAGKWAPLGWFTA